MNKNGSGVDRLTLLPDEIICIILSFLSTKDAVVTSVLSKRYRSLFASVPTIDLDYGHFLLCYGSPDDNPYGIERTEWKCGDAECRFNKFMNKILIPQSQINRFCIRCTFSDEYRYSRINNSLVNSWILESIKRNVHMIDIGDIISFTNSKNFSGFLPNEMFLCRTLAFLKLCIKRTIKVPEQVDLPNLKELDVSFGSYIRPDMITKSLHNLFLGCPVLEDLLISCSIYDGVHVLCISIPSLKRLKIDCYSKMPKFIVDAPNLLHFEYISVDDRKIEMKNLNSLVNARVTLLCTSSGRKCFPSWIAGVSHVKSLSIKSWYFGGGLFPEFPALKHLELHGVVNDYGEILSIIVNNMLALEFLVIDPGNYQHGKEHIGFRVSLNAPICPFQCLKEVEFRNFCGHQNDFELVQYILQHGETLKRMTICPSKKQDPICDELLALTKSSKICEIVFA